MCITNIPLCYTSPWFLLLCIHKALHLKDKLVCFAHKLMQQTHKTNESLAPQPLSRTDGTTSWVGLALPMGFVSIHSSFFPVKREFFFVTVTKCLLIITCITNYMHIYAMEMYV